MENLSYDKSNIIKRVSFSWVGELISGKKWKDFLESNKKSEALSIESTEKRFNQEWTKELNNKSSNSSLLSALWRTFKQEFILTGIFKLSWSGLMLLSAFYFVRSLIELSQQEKHERDNGQMIIYSIFFFLSTWLMNIMQEQMLSVGNRLGARCQALLIYLIYRKAQKLENITVSTSYVANMVLNDCSRVYEGATAVHVLWSAPIQALSIVGLLVYQIGYSGFITLAIISLVVPSLWIIGQLITRSKNENVSNQNKRMSILFQTLLSIKLVKFYVWEQYFQHNLYAARKKQVEGIETVGLLKTISFAIVFSTPPVVAAVLFSSYVAQEGELDSTLAFTTLSLFNTLRFPLVVLPKSIKTSSECIDSIKRIQSFLLQPEFQEYTNEFFIIHDQPVLKKILNQVDDQNIDTQEQLLSKVTSNQQEEYIIAEFENVELGYTSKQPSQIAKWIADNYQRKRSLIKNGVENNSESAANKNGQKQNQNEEQYKQNVSSGNNKNMEESIKNKARNPLLKRKTFMQQNIDKNVKVLEVQRIQIRHGVRVGVFGSVGSGKTTFLQSMMRDSRVLSGRLEIYFDPKKVSYVQQTPWIISGNIRKNIIMDKPFDEAFYRKVIELCCLKQDLLIQPQGDLTQLFQRGTNLSGGQRQRINIARAVYMRSDVYLLDSPLSAVDYTTQQKISQNLFQDFLAGKTIIKVSHQLHLANDFDQIIILQDQQVVYSGPPENGIIDQYFPNYNQSEKQQEQGVSQNKQGIQKQEEENKQEPESSSAIQGYEDYINESEGKQIIKEWKNKNNNHIELDQTDQQKIIQTNAEYFNNQVKITEVQKRQNEQSQESEKTNTKNPEILVEAVSPKLIMPANTQNQKNDNLKTNNEIKFKFQKKASEKSKKDNDIFDVELQQEQTKSLVEKTLSKPENSVTTNLFKWIFHGSWCLFFLTMIIHVLTQVNRVVSDAWISWWTGDQFDKGDMDWYNYGYIILVITFIIKLLLRGQSFYYFARVASQSLHNTAAAFLLNGSLRFYNETPVGSILQVFSRDVEIADDMLADSFHLTVVYFLIVLTTLIVVSINLPYFSILAGTVLMVGIFMLSYYVKATQRVKKLMTQTSSLLISTITETLDGITILRAGNKLPYFLQRVKDFAEYQNNFTFIQDQVQLWLSFRLDFFGSLFVLLTSLLVSFQDVSPSDSGLAVSNCFQALVFLTWSCRGTSDIAFTLFGVENLQNFTQIQQDDPELILPDIYRRVDDASEKQERKIQLINDQKRKLGTAIGASNVHTKSPFSKADVYSSPGLFSIQRGDIEFNNVFMSYDNQYLCLKGVNFKVEAGERIGVIGRTGAGQSSIMMALFRLFKCQEGVVLIDNVDISKMSTKQLRNQLSIMPQQAVMFKGNIRTNLDPFSQYSDQLIWDALDKSFMKDAIMALPGQLDEPVDQLGQNFSLGQKQLICLARVLLKKSKILILDEATAAMDMETDRKFQSTLSAHFQGTTIMIIAHRIDTIIDSDRILIMSDGKVAQFDAPQILVQNPNSIFCQYLSQTGDHAQYLIQRIHENSQQKAKQISD